MCLKQLNACWAKSTLTPALAELQYKFARSSYKKDVFKHARLLKVTSISDINSKSTVSSFDKLTHDCAKSNENENICVFLL